MLILDQELLKRDVKGLTAALQESQARKIQLIGDLGSPCSRKAELVTDPGDIQTWIAYSRSVAMIGCVRDWLHRSTPVAKRPSDRGAKPVRLSAEEHSQARQLF